MSSCASLAWVASVIVSHASEWVSEREREIERERIGQLSSLRVLSMGLQDCSLRQKRPQLSVRKHRIILVFAFRTDFYLTRSHEDPPCCKKKRRERSSHSLCFTRGCSEGQRSEKGEKERKKKKKREREREREISLCRKEERSPLVTQCPWTSQSIYERSSDLAANA